MPCCLSGKAGLKTSFIFQTSRYIVNHSRSWWFWFHGSHESTPDFSPDFAESLWDGKTDISKTGSALGITPIKFRLKSRSWLTLPGNSNTLWPLPGCTCLPVLFCPTFTFCNLKKKSGWKIIGTKWLLISDQLIEAWERQHVYFYYNDLSVPKDTVCVKAFSIHLSQTQLHSVPLLFFLHLHQTTLTVQ